jgi:hypothetical protein
VEESREANSYAFQDNASWVKGRHTLSFGFQANLWRNPSVGYTGVIPSYTIGISTNNPLGYTVGSIPGASQTDINRANALLASLGGMISAYTQTFNINWDCRSACAHKLEEGKRIRLPDMHKITPFLWLIPKPKRRRTSRVDIQELPHSKYRAIQRHRARPRWQRHDG